MEHIGTSEDRVCLEITLHLQTRLIDILQVSIVLVSYVQVVPFVNLLLLEISLQAVCDSVSI